MVAGCFHLPQARRIEREKWGRSPGLGFPSRPRFLPFTLVCRCSVSYLLRVFLVGAFSCRRRFALPLCYRSTLVAPMCAYLYRAFAKSKVGRAACGHRFLLIAHTCPPHLGVYTTRLSVSFPICFKLSLVISSYDTPSVSSCPCRFS